jgi:hypothetical protein
MTVAPGRTGSSIQAIWVGIASAGAAIILSAIVLSQVGWDATVFVGFGEEEPLTRGYAEQRLGEIQLRPAQGHDGKFFFVQANDPWVLDPERHAGLLARPLYRSQRMFYPLIAGLGGALAPNVIVWGLLVTNLLAMGVGSWAVGLIALKMEMSPLWGLSFVLNPGLINELSIDGAGVVAAAAAFGACALFLRDRNGLGILLLALAALTREAMLIAAVGTAWWLWRHPSHKRVSVLALVVPVATAGAWAIYLRTRIGLESGVAQIQEIGLPFTGFIQAVQGWRADPLNLASGLAMLVLLVLYSRRVLMSNHLVGWAFVGFVALALVLTRPVWQSQFDITRAVAPAITAFVLLLFAPKPMSRPT